MLKAILLLFTLCFSLSAYAGQTVVLVHGYLSDGSSWRYTGISALLQRAGWQDGGHLLPYGALPLQQRSVTGHYQYTVTLPSEAPLEIQARYLQQYIFYLQQRHPENDCVLVGHSVGGVVARLLMVLQPELPVQALITIASPHLGTEFAELGLSIAHSPFAWFAPMMGMSTLNRSAGLYADLLPESPSTLLFWLNRQPHPNALYVSIVRSQESTFSHDGIVASFSQDMNYVAALAGQARVIPSFGAHGLQTQDGLRLVQVLTALAYATTYQTK